MTTGALISGGKDSWYAAYCANKKVDFVICVISDNTDSYMFHTDNIKYVKKQTQLTESIYIQKETKGKKEEELKDLENVLSSLGLDELYVGAVASNYQRIRVEEICEKLNIKCKPPLWGRNDFDLLEEMIENDFEIIITTVAAGGLSKDFLGKKINKDTIKGLKKIHKKYEISPVGEGGEYETFVLNCPLFERKLKVKKSKVTWDKNTRSGTYKILKLE